MSRGHGLTKVIKGEGGGHMKRRIGDRRSRPRFEIVGDLWGSVDVGASLNIVNLGRGGALLESPVEFTPESVHSMLAVTADESCAVTVLIRHSAPAERHGRRSFLLGVQFLDVSAALEQLLNRRMALGDGTRPVEA